MITVVIVKKQVKKGKARSSQTMVHGKKLSHDKEVSQKRKRMTFLYHESREQIGRSRPRRKSTQGGSKTIRASIQKHQADGTAPHPHTRNSTVEFHLCWQDHARVQQIDLWTLSSCRLPPARSKCPSWLGSLLILEYCEGGCKT